MDKLIIFATAILLLAGCAKDSNPDIVVGDDGLLVDIEDTQYSTRTVLSDSIKTEFISGDEILVYDTAGKSATYKYRTMIAGSAYFQKDTEESGYDKNNFEAAFYPADSVSAYNHSTKTFTAHFNSKQTCADGSFPGGATPMVSFTSTTLPSGEIKITFSNCYAVIRYGFQYETVPTSPLTLKTIELSNTANYLSGTFDFADGSVTYVSGGSKTMTLTGCSTMGALGSTVKYYYMAIPGLTSGSADMTVTVTPTTDVPFVGTFTATAASTNLVKANNILYLDPFILKPVDPGISTNYVLVDWGNDAGEIKVGQITLSNTDVTVTKGETKKIQIFGVTKWDKISTHILSGDCFTVGLDTDGSKYYVTITGDATKTGTGQAFVGDQVTNSGSYINVKVE